MTMQLVNLIQGSPEWHAHRRNHFNASDAPAMMGCSAYKKRSELVKELATGIVPEIDAATQRRFNDGHQFEALARPLAEQIIGEDLSPCVGTRGKYSASFDGLTFMNDTAFEHKTLNADLRELLARGCDGIDLPLQYQVQMEQQAMVSGCERILFMASKWTAEGLPVEALHCWYEPNAELRAQIIAGWEQLEKDVAAYVTEEAAPEVVGQSPETLPALRIEVQGAVTASNLDAFKVTALSAIRSVNTELKTDQDFADADKAVKWCEEVESRLDAAKQHALAQTESIDHLFRTIDEISEEARQVRLKLSKLVKSEKEKRKEQIVLDGKKDLDCHIGELEKRLEAIDGRPCRFPQVAADFAGAIKGLKSLDSMRDKVAVALTNAKHEANQLADRLEANRKHLMQEDGDWIALFADFAAVGTKAAEDFQALAALRIGQHKQAEAARLEKERESIRSEEQAKAQADLAQQRDLIQQQAQQEKAEITQAQQAGALSAPMADDLAGLVQDKAMEGMAGIDAKQAISTAKASAAAADTSPVMTLGQVNTLLEAAGLGKISAATLEHHGIKFTRERGAVQVTEANTKRLALLLSLGFRKLADELQAVTA
ncbi:YqaJ viral recombinase family protein [Comamonas sp. C11]|uniref:YqaJ viral recombinase family protein n=1 Tax=Comamonas sp. C11 TaxID=2966554 RepID=UPI0021128464|nr:YqaJ viral recombinase family protein [Comamonas sp. C11]UUC95451.1 YqaJ viral recombinase family protein [Comamonas sp. C11]